MIHLKNQTLYTLVAYFKISTLINSICTKIVIISFHILTYVSKSFTFPNIVVKSSQYCNQKFCCKYKIHSFAIFYNLLNHLLY